MDAARLQAKVWAGYGKSAQRVGYSFTIYRPQAATAAIVSGNVVGQPINAAFTPRSSGFNFQITSDYLKPLFHGLFDATGVNVGDYLVCDGHGTYFVIAKPDLAPNLCVECNNVISIVRPQEASAPGLQPTYIGATAGTDVAVITSWPASMIYDARGKSTGAQLPMDEVAPYFNLLLPALPAGVEIRPSDIVTDNLDRRYTVASSEFSPLGWRVVTRHAVT